jgi:hypothetical protein
MPLANSMLTVMQCLRYYMGQCKANSRVDNNLVRVLSDQRIRLPPRSHINYVRVE